MKCIRSYAQAYDYWCQKGRNEITHLNGERKPHVVMAAHGYLRRGDQPTAFFMRFYDTDLVTYFADGVVSCLTHNSMSSRAFLRNTLPVGVDAVAIGGTHFVVSIEGKTLYLPQGICTFDTRCGLQLVSYNRESWVTVNRAAYNKARVALRPFVDWRRMVHRLSPSTMRDISFRDPDDIAHKVNNQSCWGDLLGYTLYSIVNSVADHYGVLHKTERPLEVKPTSRKITLCGVQLV
jgi:hypothetical protein